MLINSVVLFLRDALPVLLFIATLNAVIIRQNQSPRWLFKGALCGAAGLAVLATFVGNISEGFNGIGFDLLTALLDFFTYVAILLFLAGRLIWPQRVPYLPAAILATGFMISVHCTNLFIYLSGFWLTTQAIDALLIGSVLGFGISFSLALLLNTILTSSLWDRWPKVPLIMLSIISTRQISEAVYFLTQADLLPNNKPMWNTTPWLPDSSEFGHLLNALTGYEASPSALMVWLQLFALAIPLVIVSRIKMEVSPCGSV